MTATETTLPPQIQSSPPPAPPPAARPRRRLVLAAALVVLAVVALALWLLTTSSQTESRQVTQPVAGAPQQQPPWAPGDVNAVPNPGSLDSSAAGYAQFCQNSASLCSLSGPVPPKSDYGMFCQNSPALCVAVKPN
jgi:hypothetical protein